MAWTGTRWIFQPFQTSKGSKGTCVEAFIRYFHFFETWWCNWHKLSEAQLIIGGVAREYWFCTFKCTIIDIVVSWLKNFMFYKLYEFPKSYSKKNIYLLRVNCFSYYDLDYLSFISFIRLCVYMYICMYLTLYYYIYFI